MSNHIQFDAFLVLDLKATSVPSDEGLSPADKTARREILEFPVLAIPPSALTLLGRRAAQTHTRECVSDTAVCGVPVLEFHAFVRPTDGAAPGGVRALTAACEQTSGVTQAQVNTAEPLPAVLLKFHRWLESNRLLGKRLCFVTCSDWDLGEMLPAECARKAVPFPRYCATYINLQRLFAARFRKTADLPEMMDALSLPLVGRRPSGRDDCKNIAHAFVELLRSGASSGTVPPGVGQVVAAAAVEQPRVQQQHQPQ